MARINLLPWRQAERERKNREFLTIVGAVLLLSLLAAFATWSYFNDTLDSQKKANEKIKQENTKLDAALKEIDSLEKQRNDMLAQMKVIQDLQGRRPIPVRVWDDIARVIPADMYLTNMKREGDVITFTGRAANNNVVSDFIRNLDASQWLENSAVRSINQPQSVAYQQPAVANASNPNTPPTRPEDNYVVFVVTTNIAKALNPDSAPAGTVQSATAVTTQTSTSSVAMTAAPQSAVSGVAPTKPQVTSATPTSTSASSTVHTTTTTVSTTTTSTPAKTLVNNEAIKPVTNETPPIPVSATTNKEAK